MIVWRASSNLFRRRNRLVHAATAATTAAVAAPASATTGPSTATLFSWSGFVDGERPPANLFAVQTVDGGPSLFIAPHLDKAEAL